MVIKINKINIFIILFSISLGYLIYNNGEELLGLSVFILSLIYFFYLPKLFTMEEKVKNES